MAGDEDENVSFSPVPCSGQMKKRMDLVQSTIMSRCENIVNLFYSMAPGRVNIIGDHVDYCGYPVLPMAIEQNIIICVVPNNNGDLDFINTNPAYEEYNCSIDNMNITPTDPRWYHYIMCGIRGIVEEFNLKSCVGMTMVVDGTIPCSAGLSSSSALVCAAALCTLHANDLKMSKMKLANLCASCEKYIGTQGGGMDQAIAFLAKKGTAKLIEFNPLRETSIELPKGATFFVVNSCVQMNKAATSDFNERVVESRIAAQILAKFHKLDWKKLKKLGDVQSALGASLSTMSNKVDEIFDKRPYAREKIREILDVTDQQLNDLCLTDNTANMSHFKLYTRAKHVYEEADRVMKFRDACTTGDADPLALLKRLGYLINESHRSLRDLYECSHTDLDELVDVCREGGALGSRLTGAGWGGCTVSLVPEDKVDGFVEHVKRNFFDKKESRKSKIESAMFLSEPGGGATIYVTPSIIN